jgi:hypothetical protein
LTINRFLLSKEMMGEVKKYHEKAANNSFENLTENDFDDMEDACGGDMFDDLTSSITSSEDSDGDSDDNNDGDVVKERTGIEFKKSLDEEKVSLEDEAKIQQIIDMGFNMTRKVIIQNLRIDGTVETAIAALISQM